VLTYLLGPPALAPVEPALAPKAPTRSREEVVSVPGTLPLEPGLLLCPLSPGGTLLVPGVALFLPYGDTYAPPLVADPV
jgi:hypothetical protein